MKLKPVLGVWALTFYGVGDVLGAGIYALTGKVVGLVGSAAWMSFVIASIVAALTGLSYAELASRMPRSAGAAIFTFEAFRRKWLSYAVGFMVLFSGIVSMAAGSRAFAGYLASLQPGIHENATIFLFFAMLTFVNLRGMKTSSGANIVCTLIELSGLVLVIAAGMKFFGRADYTVVSPPAGVSPTTALFQGGVLAFYAFIGFEDLANVAEETKDPRKTLPRAILWALAISTVVYVLVALATVSALTGVELAASKAPLIQVVQKGFPGFPAWIFALIALFAVANTALLNFVMGSRLLFGMAETGLVPRALGTVHEKTGTPRRAIAVVLAASLALAYSGTLSVLAQSTSLLLLLVFFVVNVSLCALKLKTPAPAEVFRVPIAVPALGAASALGLVFFVNPDAFRVVGVLLALIAVLFAVMRPSADPQAN